jgi:hypothetical protein
MLSAPCSILAAYAEMYGGGGKAGSRKENDSSVDLIPGDVYHFALEWLLGGKAEELYKKYVFDIRPATDDKPYYTGHIKPRMLANLITRFAEISMAEVFLIQRFVFFLTDPIYTDAIILTVLLVSSGIGSLLSERLKIDRVAVVRVAAVGIAVCAVFHLFGLPAALRFFLGYPLPVKARLAALAIAPIGLCLGIPFPSGLTALSESRKEILPWAWGMKDALSVTGSVLTRIVSTSAGFSWVLVAMAFLYPMAGLLFLPNERSIYIERLRVRGR